MAKLENAVLRSYARRGSRSVLPSHDGALCEVFHENTKLSPLSSREYGKHISLFSSAPSAQKLMAHPYKVYSLGDQVDLPALGAETELERTLLERRSHRHFTGEPITRAELARLLYFTYGRTAPGTRMRPIASPGALYPLEIYVIPHRVTGLERWVYHYNVDQHSLDVVARDDRWEAMKEQVALGDMDDPDETAVLLWITAVLQRSTAKYLDRGYRMTLMEAGEAGHNLGLLATSLGLGGYMIGGFMDDGVAELLEIDGVDEVPLVPMALGRRPVNGD
ncbi:MAG: SagB/ThcOx family dehydrogenase [Acidobacteriota bacterium]